MKNKTSIIVRLFVLLGCFILTACGGDQNDVNCINCVPAAKFKVIKRVRVKQKVQLDASESKPGPNGGELTYEWKFLTIPEKSQVKLQEPNTPRPYFYPDQPGKYVIQLIVDDGVAPSKPYIHEFFTLDAPPIAVAKIVKPVRLTEKLELNGTESEPGPDASTLTYRWILKDKPDQSKTKLFNNDTSHPYMYPDKKGKYVIQLVVNDGINDSPPDIIEFVPLNTRPVARAIYNEPVRVSETVILSAEKSEDIDDDPITCQWKLTSIPNGSFAKLSDPKSVKPTFVADMKGQYTVQLIVNDGQMDSDPFELTIKVHDNPAAKATFKSQNFVNQRVELDGTESRPGVGGGNLVYSWIILEKPPGSQAELSDPNSPKPTFVADKAGKYVIQLVVNDGKGVSAPYNLEYTTKNSPPMAFCDYNRPIYVKQVVQLDASQSFDLDNDPLTFKWLLKSKPLDSKASLASPGGPNPKFVADLPGKYVVQLVVNDGKIDSDTFTLIVSTENSKPVARAGTDITVFEGETVQLDASQSADPDGSPLVFKWSIKQNPEGSTAQLSSENKINPTFQPDVPGIYIIQLIVNDGKLDSEPDTIEIRANASVDLAPGQMDFSYLITDPISLDITGTVSVTILNEGTSPNLDPFMITLFEDQNLNNQLDQSDLILGEYKVTDGPVGKGSITIQVTASGKVSFKENIIFVMIDPLDDIPERDETNNLRSSIEGHECKPPVRQFSPQLAWEWTGSRNDYPKSNQVMCTPMIGNLTDDNNDGKIDLKDIPDIVFITFENYRYEKNGVIRVISGDGTKEHYSIGSIKHESYNLMAFPCYNPALGDIDMDGLMEIIVVMGDLADNKWAVVFEHNGELKWVSDEKSSSQLLNPASVCIADLKSDGVPDVIIGNVVMNNTGQVTMFGKEDMGMYNSVAADIDLDNQLEIIAGRTVYESDGKILWHVGELDDGFNAVANFDNDDHPEIVLVGRGKVSLIEHTGEIIWGPNFISPGGADRGDGGPPLVSDFDGDGRLDIGVAGTSEFTVFNHKGGKLWTAYIQDPSSVTSASAFDFDGDGASEIVYRDSNSLIIFNGLSGEILYEDQAGSGTFIEMPVIADVDNDNSAEIILACNSYVSGSKQGIRVYEEANDLWINTKKIWNQHAYSITNIHENGQVPQFPINNWEIYNNFRQNKMIYPFGCKDISASYIRFNTDDCPNRVHVTARVGNGGSLHIPKGTLISFYQGNPAATGSLIAEIALEKPLNPGEWIDLTAVVKNIKSGKNNIFVIADSSGKIWESNEDNNKTQRSFSCQ